MPISLQAVNHRDRPGGPADQKCLRYALTAAVTGSSSPSVTLIYVLDALSEADVGPDGDRQILIPPR
jgi:hypothetical protein